MNANVSLVSTGVPPLAPAKGARLYILDTGRVELDKRQFVAGAGRASADNKAATAIWISAPVYAVLIAHPEASVLFDASLHPESMQTRLSPATRRFLPWVAGEEDYLPNRLRPLGVAPESIDYVVASHLHFDHAGCLPWFTKATIIVHENEVSEVMKRYLVDPRSLSYFGYVRRDVEDWIKAGLNWHPVASADGDLDLVEGVRVLNFGPGHAFGMLGLLVKLPESGPIMLVSDACYTSENLGPPAQPPGHCYDSLGYERTLERIRRLSHLYGAQVWFGHDPAQFESLRKSTDGSYT